jgi:hypothetical protein
MPAFNFGQRLHEILEQGLVEPPFDDLFSPSPSTTPDSTPSSSPMVEAAELPGIDTAGPFLKGDLTETDGPSSQEKKKRRMKAKSKANKKRRRHLEKVKEDVENLYRDGPAVRPKAQKKYAKKADFVFTSTETAQSKVTSTGYTGVDDRERSEVAYELDDLVGENSRFKFDLLEWDGR